VTLPDPPVPPYVDLRDFPYTPIYRARLFGSEFHACVADDAWRAGVTLWLKSYDQVPAGSLPKEEVALCRLAELGRDLKTWRRVAAEAMRHWFEASDGRLYHHVIAELVMEAWTLKQARREQTKAATAARRRPNVTSTVTSDATETVTTNVTSTKAKLRESLSLKKPKESLCTARPREGNGHDLDFIENGPSGRSAPLRADGAPLKDRKKEQLRQKLMRFAQATRSGRDLSAAIEGLMGEDPMRSAQSWLDLLDRQMRALHWDDTRQYGQ
jgi:hypothetical protein